MLKGINDSDEDARRLVKLIAGIPAKINLIPFNEWPGAPYERSDWARIERFADIVYKAGYASPIRTPRGEDIMAACGQLKGTAPDRPPKGHKRMRGDGRTPEGRYIVDRRNPKSQFHLSVGISYPDAEDIARARARGVDPGGDIFIHGAPNGQRRPPRGDWTAGCIAVKNREIEEIYSMVATGTVVDILA
jgi:lipoprotein-anchoring transpeptidase ErfK/SrfK